jgi:hypothetical protein
MSNGASRRSNPIDALSRRNAGSCGSEKRDMAGECRDRVVDEADPDQAAR